MRRALIAIVVAATLLQGCVTGLHPRSKENYDLALLDQQLLDAAQSIATTQAELRGLAVVSHPPGTAAPARPALGVAQGSKPITIEWQGDAAELAKMLATQQGLSFESRGVVVPLPVTISAKREPYANVLTMLAAQLDYRAAVYNLPGRMVLEYVPSTGVVR